MSKKKKDLDGRQMRFDFSFEKKVREHLRSKEEVLDAIGSERIPGTMETYEEACVELAAAVKRSVREYGKRMNVTNIREHLVAEINRYFGATDKDESTASSSKMPLSIHMLNHYLSKPAEYPIPAALLFAIQHITGSLEPCRTLVEAEGGEVITMEDRQHLMLGRAEAALLEIQRVKRELKGGLR